MQAATRDAFTGGAPRPNAGSDTRCTKTPRRQQERQVRHYGRSQQNGGSDRRRTRHRSSDRRCSSRARGADVGAVRSEPRPISKRRAALCTAESVQARSYRVNVADEGEVSAAMTRVAADFGRLDGLVNNAGIVRDGLLVKVKDGAVVGRMSRWSSGTRSSA